MKRGLLLVLGVSLLAACDDDDGGEGGPKWTLVLQDEPAALLSVWGTAADDVWIVGADAGDGPTVLHYDGAGLQPRRTGQSGNLWWVSGHGDHVWMSGEGGLILRYSRSAGTFERMETPDAEPTIFGIHPLAPDDVWAVGGVLAGNRGVVWRYDGTAWSAVDDVPAEALSGGQLFKVWGRSSEDLWIVGLGRVALHRSSTGWAVVPTTRQLFTVHGDASTTLAVGGFQDGLVVQADGEALRDVTPPEAPQLNGVFVRPGGDALAVGVQGAIWRRSGGTWRAEPDTPATREDYHAVYVDPAGGEWAVGGFVVSAPFVRGMLAYRGAMAPQ